MQIIHKYFPLLNSCQIESFEILDDLYKDWNSKINLISRKDVENLYERHILHSLAIAKFIHFKSGTRVLDVGTGGGFPGIPLAILFPDVDFYLIDSVAKKIKVVNSIANELGLKNVKAEQIRLENLNKRFDFIVSRAVTNLSVFCDWAKNKISKKGFNEIPNGILYLKGGDVFEEIKKTHKKYSLNPLSKYLEEEYFSTKYLIHLMG